MSRLAAVATRMPYSWNPEDEGQDRSAQIDFLCRAMLLSPAFLKRCIPELGLLLEELHNKCVAYWDDDVKFVRVDYVWRSDDSLSVYAEPCDHAEGVRAFVVGLQTKVQGTIRLSVAVPRSGRAWRKRVVGDFSSYLEDATRRLERLLPEAGRRGREDK